MSDYQKQVTRAIHATDVAGKVVQAIDRRAYNDAQPDKAGLQTDDPLVYFRKTVAETVLGFLGAAAFGLEKLQELENLRAEGDPQAAAQARDYLLQLSPQTAAEMGVRSPFEPPTRMN